MKESFVQPKKDPVVDVFSTADYILSVQKKSGEIPWSRGGQTDNWDHIENAMALTVCGQYQAARKAYRWSAGIQMDDGSVWSVYRKGIPAKQAHRDPNMSSYLSAGLLHYYIATDDRDFLRSMWTSVSRAMAFVLEMQDVQGQIYWSKRADNTVDQTALLTGSCSIYFSLTCAIVIASILGYRQPDWEAARNRLMDAIVNKPHLFDQTKARYAMDWYYPVLSGTLQGKKANERLESMWDTFVIPRWGVRCVSDRPWVTIGETSELCISLASLGNAELSETVLGWIADRRYDNGAYWTGVTVPDGTIYTQEQTTWSGAGVILAADILYSLSRSGHFFRHGFLESFLERQLLRVT